MDDLRFEPVEDFEHPGGSDTSGGHPAEFLWAGEADPPPYGPPVGDGAAGVAATPEEKLPLAGGAEVPEALVQTSEEPPAENLPAADYDPSDPDAVNPRTGRSARDTARLRRRVLQREARIEALAERAGWGSGLASSAGDGRASDPLPAPDDPDRARLSLAEEARCRALAEDAARSVGTGDALETMMAHQLAAAHSVAMRLSGRAMAISSGEDISRVRRELGASPDDSGAARTAQSAARMMGAFRSGVVALDRMRNGHRLTITVERVGP